VQHYATLLLPVLTEQQIFENQEKVQKATRFWNAKWKLAFSAIGCSEILSHAG
jgi:hypothetical protein